MKELQIDWLGACEKCGCTNTTVLTEEGASEYLYVNDKVTCNNCNLKGYVDADGENAWACWDEFE